MKAMGRDREAGEAGEAPSGPSVCLDFGLPVDGGDRPYREPLLGRLQFDIRSADILSLFIFLRSPT